MIFNEDQQIKLNGTVLPGVVKSMEIKASARIDEQEVEGSAAKPKQATGYEDAKITIELILDDTETQTKYERFAMIQNIFRTAGQAVPQPIPIISEGTVARGISDVLFKSLSHKQESKREQMAVTLELWEYVPQTIKTQKGGSGTAHKAATDSRGSGLLEDYQDYLDTEQGQSPTFTSSNASTFKNQSKFKVNEPVSTKTKKTPARDDADVSAHLGKLRKK